MLLFLIRSESPIAIHIPVFRKQLVRFARVHLKAIDVRAITAIPYKYLRVLVVHELVGRQCDVFCVLDQNPPIQIIEDDVVSGETLRGSTAPAHAGKEVFIHDVMHYGAIRGLLRKIYSAIFITK